MLDRLCETTCTFPLFVQLTTATFYQDFNTEFLCYHEQHLLDEIEDLSAIRRTTILITSPDFSDRIPLSHRLASPENPRPI
jgi:hypothetical protein